MDGFLLDSQETFYWHSSRVCARREMGQFASVVLRLRRPLLPQSSVRYEEQILFYFGGYLRPRAI